jgi:magnesium chelatase family protein
VAAARELQLGRAKALELVGDGLNARLEGEALDKACAMDEAARALISRAAETSGLTARGWTRTLRLARTIADLEGADAVKRLHVAEALIYRRTGMDGAGLAAPRLAVSA